MSEIKYQKISKSAVFLANNIKAARKNVTNDFLSNFHYLFVHAKTTLSMECQKMKHQEGF